MKAVPVYDRTLPLLALPFIIILSADDCDTMSLWQSRIWGLKYLKIEQWFNKKLLTIKKAMCRTVGVNNINNWVYKFSCKFELYSST